MRQLHLALAAILWLGTTAEAEVLTFENYPIDNHIESTQFLAGYRFDFTADGWGTFRDNFVSYGSPYVRNGGTRLTAGGDRDGSTAFVDIRAVDGSTFSLIGFDGATMFPGFSGRIEVIGSTRGGTVVATFDLADHFASYALPTGFENLDSVRVRDTFSGKFAKEPGFSLDNLVMEHAAPEPSALVLLCLGAAGVAGYGWRRNRTAPLVIDA